MEFDIFIVSYWTKSRKIIVRDDYKNNSIAMVLLQDAKKFPKVTYLHSRITYRLRIDELRTDFLFQCQPVLDS